MKKFSFSLEKVLGYKQQSFDVLVGEMQQLQAALMQIETQILEVESNYTQKSREINEELQSGISLPKMISYKACLNALTRQSDELKKHRVSYERLIERKKDEVIRMKSEIAGLDKLKERQYLEYQKQYAKMQELSIEEFVSRKTS